MIGIVFGGLFHGIRGAIKRPRGQKLKWAMIRMMRRSPRTGFAFFAWGTCFSLLDCFIGRVRRKEDVWGPIAAGTLVGFTMPLRRGPRAMLLGAFGGFVILSCIEGLQVWMTNRMTIDQSTMQPAGMPPQDVSTHQ